MKQNYLGLSANVIDMIKTVNLSYTVLKSWLCCGKTYIEVDVVGTEEEIEKLNNLIWG